MDVTVVVTACGRPDLLKRTIETFLQFNTYPIAEWIISEDSGDPGINKELMMRYPEFTWIVGKRGQIRSIDECYARVKTPYVFHLEEDWETYKGGFIEESLKILKELPIVTAVMCRAHDPRNYHMSVVPPLLDCWGDWGYHSFNPGLRRISDYRKHFKNGYAGFVDANGLQTEHAINLYYRDNGYRMALTPDPEGYIRHIGDGRHVEEWSPKIGLCMIVKNESHIIHESLSCTLPLIDTYCITDTGSTDNTIQVIRDFYAKHNIPGEVCEYPWKDFGTNRTKALENCNGKMDYILVIDADDLITFPPNGKELLKQLILKEQPNNFILKIHQGDLLYDRSQIFKANDGWKYKGVLHEYPTNDKPGNWTVVLPDTFWMESRRLGDRNRGTNKAVRDIEVLTKGVADEPDNERYVFYLAQSYRDAGDLENAVKWYKKRFRMGRWAEEQWFAAYQVGVCYKVMGKIPHAEKWMNIAFDMRPSRVEPLHHMAQYFREKGQFHKAYHYIQLGRTIPLSKDALFVESFSYEGGILYEASIVEFYVNPNKRAGMRSSMLYLLKQRVRRDNVLSNMMFYVEPLPARAVPYVKFVSRGLSVKSWAPLCVEDVVRNTPIPPIFECIRDSTLLADMGTTYMAVTCLGNYRMIVELEKTSFRVIRMSLPFVFRKDVKEQCIGIRSVEGKMECDVLFGDSDVETFIVDPYAVEWVLF